MKLKKLYLLLSILFISNLISIQSPESRQLFEKLSGDSKSSVESQSTQNENSMNSLFGPTEEKEPEHINFSQKSEKATSKASLFSSNPDIEEKSELKPTITKINTKNPNNQQNESGLTETNSVFGPIAPGSAPINRQNQKELNSQVKINTNNSRSTANNPKPLAAYQKSTANISISSPATNSLEAKHNFKAQSQIKPTATLQNNSEGPLNSVSQPEQTHNNNKNIKNLENQVTSLIQMNERLMKRMRSHNRSHKVSNASHKKILNFL